jgi:diacylglycerol kinase (ATP)
LAGDALISEEPGQLGPLAEEAARNGAARLVVVGGDGSVNEVVNGLANAGVRDVEVAVVPRGTGYDFVRTFGIPRDLERAVEIALTGEVREIDLGLVTYRTWAGSEGRAHFANVASAGISGAIAQRANETSKALGGKISYYWATLAVFARWQTGEMRISVDDEIRGGRMIDVMVANGRYLGGGMKMLPEAEPDDGLFDVLLLGDVTKRDLLLTLPKSYRGKHLPHPRLEVLRGRVVSVDADEPLPLELDGEQPGTTPARFEIVPGALKLRVPRTP